MADARGGSRDRPVDFGPPTPLRRAAAAVATAALAALLLNPAALADWAFELPLALGPLRDGLVAATAAWADRAAELGLDRPALWLRDGLQGWRRG